MIRIDVVTIFPTYLDPLRESLPGKAIESGLVQLDVHDLRRWTHDVHRSVDDSPYGGGPGMVMKAPVWGEALDEICSQETLLVVPTPAGTLFTQSTAQRWSSESHLVFACGRYEGIDQRVVDDAGYPDAGRRGVDRRLRVAGRRVGGAGHDRGGAASRAERAWEILFRTKMIRILTVHSKVRPTPGRRAGVDSTFPRCCCRAITPASRPGGGRPPSSAPANAVPICGIGIRARRRSARTETSS